MDNMMNMNNYGNENVNSNFVNMNNDQLDLVIVKALNAKVDNVQKQVETATKDVSYLKADVLEVKNDFNTYKESHEILLDYMHRKKRAAAMKIARSRVMEILGGDRTNYLYVTFSPYFYQHIYSDAANKFDLPSWDSCSMINYNDINSQYNKLLTYFKNWKPSKSSLNRIYSEMTEKLNHGLLTPPARCSAFTKYCEVSKHNAEYIF